LSIDAPAKKSVLIMLRHSPYGSSLAKAAIDAALANAAFEQPVDLLFMGDGILQLQPNQDSQSLGIKNIGRQLASLPLYDIDVVYVDGEAASAYQVDLSLAPVDTKALTPPEIHQLMDQYDHLLGF
jgi:tRNA 2-thiouridine synthesizing protein C